MVNYSSLVNNKLCNLPKVEIGLDPQTHILNHYAFASSHSIYMLICHYLFYHSDTTLTLVKFIVGIEISKCRLLSSEPLIKESWAWSVFMNEFI